MYHVVGNDCMPSANALFFDRESSRAIDREATIRYGMPSILLMENAAIALRTEALRMLEKPSPSAPQSSRGSRQLTLQSVLIVCGSGNNGGDGYALARHLCNAGHAVEILVLGRPRDGTDAAINHSTCAEMNIAMVERREELSMEPGKADLVVDAILGTGLDRPIDVNSDHWRVIEWINSLGAPVLAADIPSGLDCDTGQTLGIAVCASRTVSFVGPKKGFILNPESRRYTGEVVIGDIGVPRELIERFGERL